jgi:hypothetical protein
MASRTLHLTEGELASMESVLRVYGHVFWHIAVTALGAHKMVTNQKIGHGGVRLHWISALRVDWIWMPSPNRWDSWGKTGRYPLGFLSAEAVRSIVGSRVGFSCHHLGMAAHDPQYGESGSMVPPTEQLTQLKGQHYPSIALGTCRCPLDSPQT